MKRMLFFALFFVVISSFSVYAIPIDKELPGYGVINAEYEQTTIQVVNGWNLIQGLPAPNWIEEGEVYLQDVKAIYALNPVDQAYVRFYPKPEQDKIANTNFAWSSYLKQGAAFWAYIELPENSVGNLKYQSLKLTPLNKTWLFKGYNFLGIKPEMVGKSVEDFKGTCEIEEFYVFEPTTQEWIDLSSTEIPSRFLASGIAIKTSDNCYFNIEDSGILPPVINSSKLNSKYFKDDSDALDILRGEKTVQLPNDDSFTTRGIEWRIMNGLRLSGYELPAMPYGQIVDSNKIRKFDVEIANSEKIIYEKASKFPFYKDNSKENFKENLPKEFGAYTLVSLFDLINAGNTKYQRYSKECLFATLYPENVLLINRGTNGSNPTEHGVFVLPFIIQQGNLYGFNHQAHSWDIDENSYPETALPATYSIVSGYLHEWVHEFDPATQSRSSDDAYDKQTYCGSNLMDFDYQDLTSPFSYDRNANNLSNQNFVSLYAGDTGREPPYAPYFQNEDTAESITAYILLPEYFRERMQGSEILKEKYNYIKNNIFGGVEFQNPSLQGKSNFEFPINTNDFYRINNISTFNIGNIKIK